MEKKRKILLRDCGWKPLVATLFTGVFVNKFDSDMMESIVLAVVLGGLTGVGLYRQAKACQEEEWYNGYCAEGKRPLCSICCRRLRGCAILF